LKKKIAFLHLLRPTYCICSCSSRTNYILISSFNFCRHLPGKCLQKVPPGMVLLVFRIGRYLIFLASVKDCLMLFIIIIYCFEFFFQFLRLARSLRFYGYLQFKPCITNYPEEDTRVIISVGDRELNFRLQTPDVSKLFINTLCVGFMELLTEMTLCWKD